MRNRLRLAVGVLFSLLFLYLAMRNIQWRELGELFRQANYLYLIPGFLIILFTGLARAYRWRALVYPHEHLPLSKLFHIVNIGSFFNNIFPAKAGELVRAYLVGRMLPGGIGQSLSTLLIERLLDVLCVVALSVLLVPWLAWQRVPMPDWALKGALLFGVGASVGTVTLLILSRLGDRGVEWLWRWVGRIPAVGSPKVKAALRNLLRGFGVLLVGRQLPGILLGSVALWFGYGLLNYMILATFGMTALPSSASALVLCATGYSMVLPSSPGAVGPFEWATKTALLAYGVADSQAVGYAFGLHLFTNIVLIILGLLGLFVEGLSYADIRRSVADIPAAPRAADAGLPGDPQS